MSTVPVLLPNTAGVDAPAVLMGYQKTWVADDSPLKVQEKSRRTGLTWAESSDDVLSAAGAGSAGGQKVYYMGYNQDMTIEYIEGCAMGARVFNYAGGEIGAGRCEGEQ